MGLMIEPHSIHILSMPPKEEGMAIDLVVNELIATHQSVAISNVDQSFPLSISTVAVDLSLEDGVSVVIGM